MREPRIARRAAGMLAALAVGASVLVAAPSRAALLVPCESNPPSPPVTNNCDHFYDPPSLTEGVHAPGDILAVRPATITAFGFPLPLASTQLKFVTRDVDGALAGGVTTIIYPPVEPALSPRPVISYQTAEDGLSQICAPSYRFQQGQDKEEIAMPFLLGQGWTVIVSDYEGFESQYAVGAQAAHGVLDGIRAGLRHLSATDPSHYSPASPVGMWGYSGGALATTWAAELAPSYAPELNIVGAAAGGIPANLHNISRNLDGGFFSAIPLLGSVGLGRAYPQLQTLLNAAGVAMAASIGTQCIETATSQYSNRRMDQYTNVANAIDLPWVKSILDENSLVTYSGGVASGKRTPTTPLFLYHAVNDELIPVADVNALVGVYCGKDVSVEYYQDAASEHISLAFSGAPLAVSYLNARFAGAPAPSTCPVPRIP